MSLLACLTATPLALLSALALLCVLALLTILALLCVLALTVLALIGVVASIVVVACVVATASDGNLKQLVPELCITLDHGCVLTLTQSSWAPLRTNNVSQTLSLDRRKKYWAWDAYR